jgi:hypothetical protein
MGLTMLLHYWEGAPNPTEDRKYSKKIRLRQAVQYTFLKIKWV